MFNIGGESWISVNDLIKQMEDNIGNKANVKYIEKQKGDVRDTWADVSKAKEELNWKSKIGISEGLDLFTMWFKSWKTQI